MEVIIRYERNLSSSYPVTRLLVQGFYIPMPQQQQQQRRKKKKKELNEVNKN